MIETRKLPSSNGGNGRDSRGRFAAGNPGGPGNPFARRTARLRSLMLESVSELDLRAIIVKLVEKAKGGDLGAAREVLTRLFGKPDVTVDPDLVDVDEMQKHHLQVEAKRDRLHDDLF